MVPADADAIQGLADRVIGPGYYPRATVLDYLERSTAKDGSVVAHVAHAGERLIGFRFALPPGNWDGGRGAGLFPDRWPAPVARSGYFQSAFLDPEFTGRGVGKRMARRALDDLAALGAEGVVTHSWKESPHNSSARYLTALGFEVVAEIPEYWRDVDYTCVLDGKPCLCTALEMVRALP
jgi:ribosomal protein S18 acetylase RimI-like enzyme